MSPVFTNTTAVGNFTPPAAYIEPSAGKVEWTKLLFGIFGVIGVVVTFVMCCWTRKDRKAKEARRAKKAADKAAEEAAKLAARHNTNGIELDDMTVNPTRPMEARLSSPVNGHPVDLRRVVNVQTRAESARTTTRIPGTATLSTVNLLQSDGANVYYAPRNSVIQVGNDPQRCNIVGTPEEAEVPEMGMPEPTHAEANSMA